VKIKRECPLLTPEQTCPFYETIIAMKTDIKWLKRVSTGNFMLLLGILLTILTLVLRGG